MLKKCLFICVLLIAGCSSNKPIIDMHDVDQQQFEKDLAECQQYQQQLKSSVPTKALGAAIVGGLIGAIYGSADSSAGTGAVLGGANGAYQDAQKKKNIVRRCLSARGYTVLE